MIKIAISGAGAIAERAHIPALMSIADAKIDISTVTPAERMQLGIRITLEEVNAVNLHMHELLYGLIEGVLRPRLMPRRSKRVYASWMLPGRQP